MDLIGVEVSIAIAHHIEALPLRVDGDALSLAHFAGSLPCLASELQPLQHVISLPVVVVQALPLVAADPERIATAVVADARKVQLFFEICEWLNPLVSDSNRLLLICPSDR